MPAPALPQVYIDTTFNQPVSGQTWRPHTATDLKSALISAMPGDVIVLDAGVTYTGNFTLPQKSNLHHQWIYIISSALNKLHGPGTRVAPADAANMPKIVTANATAPITVAPGGSFYRFAGLEVTTASKSCANIANTNCHTGQLIFLQDPDPLGTHIPDHITVDRCYLHGSPTIDVQEGVWGNASNLAVIDSYIADVHIGGQDNQAILVMKSPGPIKITNNYLSGAGETVMFGGGGGTDNPYIPSDIEIRNNYFFKPLSWIPLTTGTPKKWDSKNLLEFKTGRRVLVDSNVFENNWSAAQTGAAILFTVRTSQSGNLAVVDDITFQNNVIKNVTGGFSTLAADYNCGTAQYPNCTNKGESRRIKVYNNLVTFYDPRLPGGGRNTGIEILPNLSDYIFQHNTFVAAPNTQCWAGAYFEAPANQKLPFPTPPTHNIWLLDNVFCRQPSGDWGPQGNTFLSDYMSDPAPVGSRFLGNVMYVQSTDKVQPWPVHNYATSVPFTYIDQSQGNYQLATPDWMDTSDGKEAGVDYSQLPSTTTTLPLGIQP